MKNIGARVKAVRLERGMTSIELGQKVGISQAQISRLESGKQGWRSITLQKTAKALGVSVAFLFANEKTDGVAALMLAHKPELKNILNSPTLVDTVIKLAKLRRVKPVAFRAVKTLVEQLS